MSINPFSKLVRIMSHQKVVVNGWGGAVTIFVVVVVEAIPGCEDASSESSAVVAGKRGKV